MCSIECPLPSRKRNQGIVSSKKSRRARRFPCCHIGDELLRLSAERNECLSLVQIPLSASPGSGDSRNVESVFLRFPCDSNFLSGWLSEVYLEFCNQRYRDKFPSTYLADFLRDACDVCPREVSDRFPCTARFVCCNGRWIFSLRD